MKIPIIPLVVAASLVAIVLIIFNSMTSEHKVLGAPHLERLVDLEGIETEVTIGPDGTRLVAVASGDLWLFDTGTGSRQRLTETVEPESFPAWTPDGTRVTFTRGADTFATEINDFKNYRLFKENATSLSWAPSGRIAFVRDRRLWITDAAGLHEQPLTPSEDNPDVTVFSPRFSPDSSQIAFIKTRSRLHADVWVADATDGTTRALVEDRWAEDPLDVGWLNDGRQLVYLTNRSGAYALWIVDFEANTIAPLTSPLEGPLLDRIGISVWHDRIVIPRHFLDSNIVASDGAVIASTEDPEFEPAASRDGSLIAYTIQKGNKFEIWTADDHGGSPKFQALGTQPRFSPSGFELVYTATDPEGRVDLRKVDIRDGSSISITDAAEVDFEPDWSPDGRTIVFASDLGGTMALWTMPSVDGKRSSLRPAGYFPRFSPDGRSIVFWHQGALWRIDSGGDNENRIRDGLPDPTPAAWINREVRTYLDIEVNGGKAIWPDFDVLPDGRVLIAPITIQDTALWAVDLTYVTE